MKKFIITTVLACALATTAFAAPLKPTTLRVGSTGQTVMTVQQKLIDLGLSESAVDGKYGKKTAAAVAKFQLSKNLKSDGLVGEKTLAMILASKAPSKTQPIVLETAPTSINTNTPTSNTALRTTKPIIDVPVVISDVPLSDEVAWRILCRDRKPHIQVLSPNGGEVYQAGQKITVKWRSCNVQGNIGEINLLPLDMRYGRGMTYDKQIPNTGSYTLTLPETVDPYWSFGKNFKIELKTGPDGSISDVSNNLFTINAPTIDMCPNISGVQTTIPTGMIKDSFGNCLIIPIPTSTTWDVLCSDGQPHIQVLSPNGGEVYQAGQQIIVKWKSCNIPRTENIQVNLMDTISSIDFQTNTIITPNDGQETFTLPTTNWDVSSLTYGTRFKIGLWTIRGEGFHVYQDWSDNLFTINAPTIDMCPNISGIQTIIPTGMIKDSAGNCVQSSGLAGYATFTSNSSRNKAVLVAGTLDTAVFSNYFSVKASVSDITLNRSCNNIQSPDGITHVYDVQGTGTSKNPNIGCTIVILSGASINSQGKILVRQEETAQLLMASTYKFVSSITQARQNIKSFRFMDGQQTSLIWNVSPENTFVTPWVSLNQRIQNSKTPNVLPY